VQFTFTICRIRIVAATTQPQANRGPKYYAFDQRPERNV